MVPCSPVDSFPRLKEEWRISSKKTTSSLLPVASLAILQADHVGKITSEERSAEVSQSTCKGKRLRTQPPAWMIQWGSKNSHSWADSSEFIWSTKPPSPQVTRTLRKQPFLSLRKQPFTYLVSIDWLISGQPNLSSVTRRQEADGVSVWLPLSHQLGGITKAKECGTVWKGSKPGDLPEVVNWFKRETSVVSNAWSQGQKLY